jgi:hypothetical protein
MHIILVKRLRILSPNVDFGIVKTKLGASEHNVAIFCLNNYIPKERFAQ